MSLTEDKPSEKEKGGPLNNKWTRLPLRTRPHRNPLAANEDDHPESPEDFNQRCIEEQMFPVAANSGKTCAKIEFADIGCAFGGMLFALAPHFPDTLMIGLEIRSKVVEFAQGKARALRAGEFQLPDPTATMAAAAGADAKKTDAAATSTHATTAPDAKLSAAHHYNNLWFQQSNVMKFGDCYFERGQLQKLVFSHPDPHWKKSNVRRRIIAPGLVQRYAHWLAPGGLLYTVSDVPELEDWMVKCLDESPQFERVTDEEYLKSQEWLLEIITSTSEDAQRAVRKKLMKNFAVHRRMVYDDKKIAPLF